MWKTEFNGIQQEFKHLFFYSISFKIVLNGIYCNFQQPFNVVINSVSLQLQNKINKTIYKVDF